MRRVLKALSSKRALVAMIACVILAFMTGLRTADPDFLKSIRELTFDQYQRLHPRDYQTAPVRIVDLDEASIAEIGQWPWPRTKIAEMVRVLTDLGAATIVFDVVFSEPDRTSPAQLKNSLAATTPREVLEALEILPDHDEQFADAIAKAPVVLGFAVTPDETGSKPVKIAGTAFGGQDPVSFLPPFPAAVTNLEVLQKSASGIGSISISEDDREGIVRRVPLIVSDGEQIYPSLVAEALRVAQGASGIIARSTGSSSESATGDPAVTAIKIGDFTPRRLLQANSGFILLLTGISRNGTYLRATFTIRRNFLSSFHISRGRSFLSEHPPSAFGTSGQRPWVNRSLVYPSMLRRWSKSFSINICRGLIGPTDWKSLQHFWQVPS